MKLNSIIAIPLVLVYSMLTFIDTGIFNCGCTHEQYVVSLNVQQTCPPCSKSNEGCCAHNEHHDDVDDEDDENDDCCSLSYKYVVVDQLNIVKSQSYDNQVKILSLFTFPHYSQIIGVAESYAFTKNHSPPPNSSKIPTIYMYGQLRL